jgi:two-component system, OmpR family, response regulator CpxR
MMQPLQPPLAVEPGEIERGRSSILLVDDDVDLSTLIREYLERSEYAVECVYNGRDGLARALTGAHDLIILDGMLPALDGLEVLRQLRKRNSTPVIMLTARTQEEDRITGLDSGADDYLPKPFSPGELSARIRAVLRRYRGMNPAEPKEIRCGTLELNPVTRVARRSDEEITLTEIEFQILELLMRSAGRTVSRDEISTVLYQREATPYERGLDVHVSHLRKKIEADGTQVIRTVRGVGYMLAADER